MVTKVVATDPSFGGNCLQAAIASLLDLYPHEVPHLMAIKVQEGPDKAIEVAEAWFAERGLGVVVCHWPLAEQVIKLLGDDYYLVLGWAADRDEEEGHACVAQHGKIFHDPSYCGLKGGPEHWQHLFILPVPRLEEIKRLLVLSTAENHGEITESIES